MKDDLKEKLKRYDVMIGQRLRKLRLVNNIKQRHISMIFGIDRSAYSNYELGRNTVHCYYLREFCNFYKIPMDILTSHNGQFFDEFIKRYNESAE